MFTKLYITEQIGLEKISSPSVFILFILSSAYHKPFEGFYQDL